MPAAPDPRPDPAASPGAFFRAFGERKIALLTRKGLVVAPVPVLRAWRRG